MVSLAFHNIQTVLVLINFAYYFSPLPQSTLQSAYVRTFSGEILIEHDIIIVDTLSSNLGNEMDIRIPYQFRHTFDT